MENKTNKNSQSIFANLFVLFFLAFVIFSSLNSKSIERTTFIIEKGMSLNNRESPDATFLGIDALFKGELRFKGTLCIDGKFEGQIKTDDMLIVSETGDIEADIEAGTVVCKGTIKGNVTASQKVEMHPSSKIIGNVTSPSLSIEVGAKVEGSIDMSNKEKAKTINLNEHR